MLGSLNPNISSTPGNIIFLAWVITQNIRRRFPSLINLPIQKYCINSKCNISTKTPVNIVMHVLIQGLFPPTYASPALLKTRKCFPYHELLPQKLKWSLCEPLNCRSRIVRMTVEYFSMHGYPWNGSSTCENWAHVTMLINPHIFSPKCHLLLCR